MNAEKKKFELTANAKVKHGRTLYQIRALKDFGNIKKGDLGGWLEKEESLSQRGECWVFESADVFDKGLILGGEIWGGEIRGGLILGGEIWGGVIRGGEIWGGVIRGGEIRGGEIRGGLIWGGVIRGGLILGGEIWGGVIRGGEIWGGLILGGEILGGVIRGGEISKSSDYVAFCSIGSENGILTAYRTEDGGIEVTRGCFRGTLAEFEKAVKEKHKDSSIGKEYELAISIIKQRFNKPA
jgi:hypothetical protein